MMSQNRCSPGQILGAMRRHANISQDRLIKMLILLKPVRKYESCFNQPSWSRLERGETSFLENAQQFLPLIEDAADYFHSRGYLTDSAGNLLFVRPEKK